MTSSVAPGSQKENFLFDFLYVDRPRVAAFGAQLFDDGNITTTKQIKASSAGLTNSTAGGVPGLLKGTVGGSESTQESLERTFDATWSAVLNILREMNDRGYIREVDSAALGQIVLFRGSVQILDYRMLQKLWRPIMATEHAKLPERTSHEKQRKKAAITEQSQWVEVVENLPHLLQLRAFNDTHQAWGTLQPESMTINASDLMFKYGPSIPGEWLVLATLDAKPFSSDYEMKLPKGIGDLESGLLQMGIHLQGVFGRSSTDYAITPLALYRVVRPGDSASAPASP